MKALQMRQRREANGTLPFDLARFYADVAHTGPPNTPLRYFVPSRFEAVIGELCVSTVRSFNLRRQIHCGIDIFVF